MKFYHIIINITANITTDRDVFSISSEGKSNTGSENRRFIYILTPTEFTHENKEHGSPIAIYM